MPKSKENTDDLTCFLCGSAEAPGNSLVCPGCRSKLVPGGWRQGLKRLNNQKVAAKIIAFLESLVIDRDDSYSEARIEKIWKDLERQCPQFQTVLDDLRHAARLGDITEAVNLSAKLGLVVGVRLVQTTNNLKRLAPILWSECQKIAILTSANNAKRQTATEEDNEINQAVAAHIKKRGRHKQPSLTTIRQRVAEELGKTYTRVLDAQRGGRKGDRK